MAAINDSSVPKSGPKTIPPAITSMLPGNRKRVAMMNNRIKSSNFKTMALIIRELGMSVTEFFDSPIFDFNNLDIDD